MPLSAQRSWPALRRSICRRLSIPGLKVSQWVVIRFRRCSTLSLKNGILRGRSIVTGNKASFYPIDAEQFKGLAGEEVTQMMQYFGDFGCESSAQSAPVPVSCAVADTSFRTLHRICRLRWKRHLPLSKSLGSRVQRPHLEDLCRGSRLVQDHRLIQQLATRQWLVLGSSFVRQFRRIEPADPFAYW
jgi:hypothetical protein